MRAVRSTALSAMEDYLRAEVCDKKLDSHLGKGWRKHVCHTTSQQTNGRDCGVHVCINALLLFADLEVSGLASVPPKCHIPVFPFKHPFKPVI